MAALALASYLKTAVADARLPWVEWHLQVSNLALHRQLTAVLRQMDEICRQRGQEPPFDTAQGLAAGLNPDFTFERFVVGEENEQAYAQAVIAGLGGPKNNVPLLIYGDCGLGKTHLLHAVGWKYQTINPEKRVVLLHGTEFADLATCDATLKTVDALLIDDFHSLLHFLDAAKRHTLLASLPLLAVTAGQMDWRQVILTDQRATPTWIEVPMVTPGERLANRLLDHFLLDSRLQLTSDLRRAVLSRANGNSRALQGIVIKIAAFESFYRQKVDSALLSKWFSF